VAFYQTAVKGGHVQAMVNLGVMVDQGRGIRPSGLVAQDLFLAAVRAGDAKGKNDLAYLWARQGGLLEEALCLSSQALQVEPHHGGYLNVHGFILQRLGRSAEARRFFELALRQSGNDDFALEQLGDMAYAQHDPAAAKRYWQRALVATLTVMDADRLRDKLGGWYHNPLPHSEFEFKNPDGFGRDCGQQTS
jgi:tetratricopeptide (TPR) repeat protein